MEPEIPLDETQFRPVELFVNPFQSSDAMWHHTFHLSLIRRRATKTRKNLASLFIC
jgi:hypothetical protein